MEGGIGIFGFAVLNTFLIGFSVFVSSDFAFSVLVFNAVCWFFVSIWFSDSVKFSVLVPSVVFGFSYFFAIWSYLCIQFCMRFSVLADFVRGFMRFRMNFSSVLRLLVYPNAPLSMVPQNFLVHNEVKQILSILMNDSVTALNCQWRYAKLLYLEFSNSSSHDTYYCWYQTLDVRWNGFLSCRWHLTCIVGFIHVIQKSDHVKWRLSWSWRGARWGDASLVLGKNRRNDRREKSQHREGK